MRTIFGQPDTTEVAAQFDRVVAAPESKLPAAAVHLSEARDDPLAITAVPREVWQQIWSSNPQRTAQPRAAPRHRRRGVFPGRDSIIRLVGTVHIYGETNGPSPAAA